SSGTQLPHSLIEDGPSDPDHLLSSSNSDSGIEVVSGQFIQSQSRVPVTAVELTQETDEEILDSAQRPAVSTAPPESPSSSHFIPCSPPPRVVPPLVSPSSQNQCSGSEPTEVPSTPQPTADQDYVYIFRDTRATLRPVDHSQQPSVPTPQQPTAYNHPEGRSAMILPPAPPM
ncbi:hypothetical protein L9F63_025099, partial [Diploptera punctata]